MSGQDKDSAGYDRFVQKKGLRHEVATMPTWKKMLLFLSLLVGIAGFAAQEAKSVLKKTESPVPTAPTHVAPASPAAPAGSSGFVGSGGPSVPATPAAGNPALASPDTPAQSMSDHMTPYATRIGFSVFVGAVLGFVFRTFLRMAVGITALVVAIGAGLSYFHILPNVDLTTVKTDTANVSAWITDQAYRLKAVIFHALPSSTAAGAGFIFGFKRR